MIRFNDFKVKENQDFVDNKTDLIFITNSYLQRKHTQKMTK